MQQPILHFANARSWEAWLSKNFSSSKGLWLQIRKKTSPQPSPSYAEALDVALCYGWIDGQTKRYDEDFYLQRFTQRRPRSLWSKINTAHAERLVREGRMKEPGLRQIQAARADGRWDQAYSSPKDAQVPDDFLDAVRLDKDAHDFFLTLNRSATFAICHKLETCKKPETRQRRMDAIIAKLRNKDSKLL